MIENSSAGLAMVAGEMTVTVTGEERHQSVLARYSVAPGTQRHVAVELGWCTIGSGKYRGQQAIEVRLDGYRVGELTQLMSRRYGAMVSQVAARGGRAGCEALIQRGARGLEIVLRLPREHTEVLPLPQPATPRRAGNTFTLHRPAWIAAAVLAVLLIGAVATTTSNSKNASSPASEPTTTLDTSTSAPITTTTQPTTTPPPAEVAPPVQPPVVQPPAPKPATKTPPPATQKPQPQPKCDPNYTGCVPVASDVDCLGGSGNGPAYVAGPINVIGRDIYGLDADHDGIACE